MKTIFFFTLFVSIGLNATAQWTEVPTSSSIGAGADLNSLFFLNADTGYVEDVISQYDSDYYKTTDGGINWTLTSIEDAKGEIYFINDTLGFVGGSPIQKTIDGGITWSANDSVAEGEVIQFLDDSIGYVSSQTTLYKTIDAGSNWTQKANVSSYGGIRDMHFINEDVGYLVGRNSGDGLILKTTDGGITWTQDFLGGHPFTAVYFSDVNNGYVVGTGTVTIPGAQNWEGVIYKTTDGGDNWVEQFRNVPECLLDIEFTSVHTGYVAGFFSTILKTENGGDDWQAEELPRGGYWNSIFFVNKDIGYVSGKESLMLKTTNGGALIITNEDNSPDLVGVYPNPATSTITIDVEQIIQQVRIFDLNGKVVLEINDGESESLSLDIGDLSVGYYTLYVKMENGVLIQKIIKE